MGMILVSIVGQPQSEEAKKEKLKIHRREKVACTNLRKNEIIIPLRREKGRMILDEHVHIKWE